MACPAVKACGESPVLKAVVTDGLAALYCVRNTTPSHPIASPDLCPVSLASPHLPHFPLWRILIDFKFRAESRAKQVAWVGTLQRHARQAAEDSYMSVAEHMVCDEVCMHFRYACRVISYDDASSRSSSWPASSLQVTCVPSLCSRPATLLSL